MFLYNQTGYRILKYGYINESENILSYWMTFKLQFEYVLTIITNQGLSIPTDR